MFPLIETIRIKDGLISNLSLHQARVDRALKILGGGNLEVDLIKVLDTIHIPAQGFFKCRVIYSMDRISTEIASYSIRPVERLKLIANNKIEYGFKFEDRSELNSMFDQRGDADDILIVKNDRITDTSYANIVFNRNGAWVTPRSCLLRGTQREFLLDSRQIAEEDIGPPNMREFSSFKLINSMLLFESPALPIENIINL